MTRHYYVVKLYLETVIFSSVKEARKAAADYAEPTVWEIYDNGMSGAQLVVGSGKEVTARGFIHDETREPFTLLPTGRQFSNFLG